MSAQEVDEFIQINLYFKSVIDLIPIDSYLTKSMTNSESTYKPYNGKSKKGRFINNVLSVFVLL